MISAGEPSGLLLSIESSCDETAAAVVSHGAEVWSEEVFTQATLHAPYGGVVPEIASRDHLRQLIPVIDRCVESSGSTWAQLDAIAVTRGPGLVGSLLMGVEVAKALAVVKKKPLIPVNHLAGHLSAIALHERGTPAPETPSDAHLALVVSGGHSALYRVDGVQSLRVVTQTRDDAAGEAFDKVARLLGLGYPGGPVVEATARGGDPMCYPFSMPRFKDGQTLSMSFSGLKTSVLQVLQREGRLPQGQALQDLLASFQRAVCEQLVDRSLRALRQEGLKDLILVGGVACNQSLRETLASALATEGGRLFVPPRRWCTDNAAMIAAAAWRLIQGDPTAALSGSPARRLNVRSAWPAPSAFGGYE